MEPLNRAHQEPLAIGYCHRHHGSYVSISRWENGKTRPGIRCTATFICLFSISTAQIEICVSGGYIVAAKVSLSLMTTSVFDGSWP